MRPSAGFELGEGGKSNGRNATSSANVGDRFPVSKWGRTKQDLDGSCADRQHQA